MFITATMEEIFKAGCIEKLCVLKGWDEYHVRERYDPDREYTLTLEEAREIGLIE